LHPWSSKQNISEFLVSIYTLWNIASTPIWTTYFKDRYYQMLFLKILHFYNPSAYFTMNIKRLSIYPWTIFPCLRESSVQIRMQIIIYLMIYQKLVSLLWKQKKWFHLISIVMYSTNHHPKGYETCKMKKPWNNINVLREFRQKA
jgi:hypothetical protein